jgi:single-strand DNA-binding protein
MLNKILIEGNLAKEPDYRALPGGGGVCTLRLVNNNKYMSNGEIKEESTFVNVNVFGRQAENCRQYLSKGSHIIVEGKLRENRWTSRDGDKRSTIEITADTVHFMSKSNNQE